MNPNCLNDFRGIFQSLREAAGTFKYLEPQGLFRLLCPKAPAALWFLSPVAFRDVSNKIPKNLLENGLESTLFSTLKIGVFLRNPSAMLQAAALKIRSPKRISAPVCFCFLPDYSPSGRRGLEGMDAMKSGHFFCISSFTSCWISMVVTSFRVFCSI